MTDLVVLPAHELPGVRLAASEATRLFQLAAESDSTKKAYATDWRTFTAWCLEAGVPSLPAHPISVANFLTAGALEGKKASTLGRRAAAICYAHRLKDLPPPTASEEVRKTLRGIRRSIGAKKTRKTAATAEHVLAMMKTCDDTLRGKRDRALLALGFAGAFRRSELVALRVEDVALEPGGARITIRTSKTDKERLGQVVPILAGNAIRPILVLQDWLSAAGITSGPIFRRIQFGGKVGSKPLSGYSVAGVIKTKAALIGLDPTTFSGHSLRSGFITSAAMTGASLFKMQAISRHKSIEMLNAYVRDAEVFDHHAGSAFL